MPRRRTPLLAAVFLAASVPLSGATSTASATAPTASAQQFHEKVEGFLQGYPGDCPLDEAPQDPLVCHEVVITAYKYSGTDADGGMPPQKAPWTLVVLKHTLTFPGGGQDPTESDAVNGYTFDPVVTFDQQHLATARIHSDDVTMDDGTTMSLDATWTATSPRIMSGNEGPLLADNDLVRHLHEYCLNDVHSAHQKYRIAHVHALIDGVASDDLGTSAFLAYNQFLETVSVPAHC